MPLLLRYNAPATGDRTRTCGSGSDLPSGDDILDLIQIVMYVLALVLSISVHEFSHAWAAYELGDPTARNLGREI